MCGCCGDKVRFTLFDWEMSHDKTTKWVCAQQRLRSAWASAQPDQSLRCAFNGQLRTQGFFMRTLKTLIRLGGCPGWSESSLGTHAVCWFLSYPGSNSKMNLSRAWVVHEPHHEKTCLREFATRKDSNRPAQLQKLDRVLKFCTMQV